MNIDSVVKSETYQKLIIFLDKKILVINILLIIVIIILTGSYIINTNKNKSKENEIKEEFITLNSQNTDKIVVNIEGAVITPGIYSIDNGSRIVDIIDQAGGFSEEVDYRYVEKNINQAQKLTDSQKIYIPRMNENNTTQNSTNFQTENINNLVSINTGSREELIALPEIGEATADKIIDSRPYDDINQIVSTGAMKQNSFDKIKDLISL